MTRLVTATGLTLFAAIVTGCASVPKDSGFADVRRTVIEQTQQPVEWDPRRPVEPPDDKAVSAMLQEELTAERAVQIAFANNRDLQATLEGLGLARADLIAASTIRNPILDGEIRFAGSLAKPFELALSQSLIDILQLGKRKKLGRVRFEAAGLQVSAAVINFAAQVRLAYYDLLAARRILARQNTILKAQEAATDLARRQHSAGNISDLDLEKEQSRYEQVKLDSARAQLDELQAHERLIADLGLVERADPKLPDDFPIPPPSEMTAEEIERQLTTRRLDIQMAEREIEAARRALGLAKTAVIDDLAVGVHHEREPEGKSTTGPAASIPIPIFDRGTAQKTRARAMLRQAQQRLAAMTVYRTVRGADRPRTAPRGALPDGLPSRDGDSAPGADPAPDPARVQRDAPRGLSVDRGSPGPGECPARRDHGHPGLLGGSHRAREGAHRCHSLLGASRHS